ncbi:MAG: alpha/beta fold hydrolase [Rhizomicrobium sp.]
MQSETLEIGSCEITVERCGKGAPVVVLHGEDGPRNANAFLEKLAENFEVHVPRHAGWPDTRRASHIRTVRDVALVSQEYIERFDGPVAVVGLSFGGWLAAEIAANAPMLVSSMVLISPIGVKLGEREDRDFADLYILPVPEREALYYSSAHVPLRKKDTNIDAFLEKAIADDAIARYCWQPYMHDPGLKGRLRRIRAATLIISGDRDRFILHPAYYNGYTSLIPGARDEVIAGAGHRVEEEEPHKLAARVANFVSAPASARTAA